MGQTTFNFDEMNAGALRESALQALDERGLKLAFPVSLEAHYAAHQAPARAREQFWITVIAVFAYVALMLVNSALIVTTPVWSAVLAQITLLPAFAITVGYLVYRPERGTRLREGAMLFGASVFSVATIGPMVWSPPEVMAANLALAILPAIGSLFLLRLPFWSASVLVVVTAVAIAVVFAVRPDFPAAQRAYPIGFLLGAGLPALLGVHRLERAARRDYLHGLLRAMENRQLVDENQFLNELSATDPLTGAANRRRLDGALQALCAAPAQEAGGDYLLLIDVDRFKQFNDKYGHLAGDSCLREVVWAITGQVRKNDLVARFGGEEFAVLLSGVNEDEAQSLAERVRAAVAAHRLVVEQEMVAVSVSIGIARRVAEEEARRLIRMADAALYMAKNNGRNCVCWPPGYDPDTLPARRAMAK